MSRCLLLNQSGHGTSSIAALAVTLRRVTQRDHQRSQERPKRPRETKRDQERSVSRYPQQNLKMPNRMGWLRWLPGLIALREYQASWLMHDIAAGGVLATMLVPVGIAYAVASGVPGIYGLYATIVPLLAYALFGPSRILVLGPDSALVAIILGVVFPLSQGNALRAVALAGVMAIV